MQRRKLLMAGLGGLAAGRPAYAAAEDWHRTLGYPTGWGFRRDWTDKLYRIGNYSGGYETMFRTRTISAGSRQVSPLQGPGANNDALASMSGSIAEYLKAWPVTGLLIARKGRIVFEQYQFDRTPDMRFTSWSMAKSVTSLLLGICLDRGLIHSLEDTPDQYVGEFKGTLHGGVTLRNLSNMSSGAAILHDRDNATIYPKAFLGRSADLEPVVRGWNASGEAQGTRFNYNELCPLTVGMVIRRVTGKSLAEFCQEALWQPMGAEADATWLCDSMGKEYNCIGFGARLRDWARLGQLVAQRGNINGQQVVSERWITECSTWSDKDTQVRHGAARPGTGYKAFFWHPKADGSWMMMNGHHGQRVLVDQGTQTVLVQTAVDHEGPWQTQLFSLFAAACRAG